MEINRLVNTINCNVQTGRRVEYIVIHYVALLGEQRITADIMQAGTSGRQRIILSGMTGRYGRAWKKRI